MVLSAEEPLRRSHLPEPSIRPERPPVPAAPVPLQALALARETLDMHSDTESLALRLEERMDSLLAGYQQLNDLAARAPGELSAFATELSAEARHLSRGENGGGFGLVSDLHIKAGKSAMELAGHGPDLEALRSEVTTGRQPCSSNPRCLSSHPPPHHLLPLDTFRCKRPMRRAAPSRGEHTRRPLWRKAPPPLAASDQLHRGWLPFLRSP